MMYNVTVNKNGELRWFAVFIDGYLLRYDDGIPRVFVSETLDYKSHAFPLTNNVQKYVNKSQFWYYCYYYYYYYYHYYHYYYSLSLLSQSFPAWYFS
jgi:hypothetical protein